MAVHLELGLCPLLHLMCDALVGSTALENVEMSPLFQLSARLIELLVPGVFLEQVSRQTESIFNVFLSHLILSSSHSPNQL